MSIVLDGTTGITTPGLTNTGSETVVNLTTTGNTILGDASTDTLNVGNGGLVKDASGNLGLGVTPSANAGQKTLSIANQTGGFAALTMGSNFTQAGYIGYNMGNTGTNSTWKYISADVGSALWFNGNEYRFMQFASGSAGATTSGTQAMTLDASGNLVVGGTSNPASARFISENVSGNQIGLRYTSVATWYNSVDSSGNYIWKSDSTERARITSGGSFQLGANNDGVVKSFTVYQGGGAEGTVYGTFTRTNGGSNSLEIQNANDFFANAANAACRMGRNSVNTRSLNAGGTVNASGADYAEYMTKAGDFAIAKGDVVGIDSNGKLTNVFADAVSFMVKSTDPSYVGGDTWGIGFEDDAEGLEAARQRVDRIAFAGQVPVNVMGATAGQYIIPVNDNGAIKGEAVSNPTFEQYQTAVGKVIAIESDGRAKIIVKVA
jgi:hypothetical protein